jgi:hypothetical protein
MTTLNTIERRILAVLRDRKEMTSSDLAKALGEKLNQVAASCQRLKALRLLAERRGADPVWTPAGLWRRCETILGLLREGQVEAPNLADALDAPLTQVRRECHRREDLGLLTKTLIQRRTSFKVFPVTLEALNDVNRAAVRAHLAALQDIVDRYPPPDPRLAGDLNRYLASPAHFPSTPGMRFRIEIFQSRLNEKLRAKATKDAIDAMFKPWRRIRPAFGPYVLWWRLTAAARALTPSAADPHHLLKAA